MRIWMAEAIFAEIKAQKFVQIFIWACTLCRLLKMHNSGYIPWGEYEFAWQIHLLCSWHRAGSNTAILGELLAIYSPIVHRTGYFYLPDTFWTRVCYLACSILGNRMCYQMGAVILLLGYSRLIEIWLTWLLGILVNNGREDHGLSSIQGKIGWLKDIRRRLSLTWTSEVDVFVIEWRTLPPIWRWRELWLIHSAC